LNAASEPASISDQIRPSDRTVISPPFSREVSASAPSSTNAVTIMVRAISRIRTVKASSLSRKRGET
jgi:hypothetical protein